MPRGLSSVSLTLYLPVSTYSVMLQHLTPATRAPYALGQPLDWGVPKQPSTVGCGLNVGDGAVCGAEVGGQDTCKVHRRTG